MVRCSRKGIGAAGAAARTSQANRARCLPQGQPQMQGAAAKHAVPAAATGSATASAAAPGPQEKVLPEGQRVPRPSPGNSINAPQGKRRGRQKGPRMFVGPMDHSYRVANGNVADGPPSTIPTAGNGHSSGYYPDVYSGQAPPRPFAKTLPRASSASLKISSSWPRFRRRRANWA